MGLDVSHNAFSGTYTGFSLFRKAVAAACGGSYPPHDPSLKIDGKPLDPNQWYWEGEIYSKETHPGLHHFLCHSDCDGIIGPEMAGKIADEMELLLPQLGDYIETAQRFIKGCRSAAKRKQKLTFR